MEIRHHAFLYAVLCKHIIEEEGEEKGKKTIEKFTDAYGIRRGERMKKNSVHGDLNDFFINGEWKGREGENISVLSYGNSETSSLVSKCAWYDAWKEYGLLEYGKYYCRYIDKAICKGYASTFDLDVKKTMGNGDDVCLFVWNKAADKEKVSAAKKDHILPFDFHCRELLECVSEVLDEEVRETVLLKSREDFAKAFLNMNVFDL